MSLHLPSPLSPGVILERLLELPVGPGVVEYIIERSHEARRDHRIKMLYQYVIRGRLFEVVRGKLMCDSLPIEVEEFDNKGTWT